jgi:hypothetical protein
LKKQAEVEKKKRIRERTKKWDIMTWCKNIYRWHKCLDCSEYCVKKQRICKIRVFHGGDYEECLLGYKNPVRTLQETHYVSATEPNQLMLCRI